MICTHQKRLAIATYNGIFVYEPMSCTFIEQIAGNDTCIANLNDQYFVATEEKSRFFDIRSKRKKKRVCGGVVTNLELSNR